LLGAIIPPHGSNKAHHGFTEVATAYVVEDVFGAVAFAELFVPLLVHDVRQVREHWKKGLSFRLRCVGWGMLHVVAEGFVQVEVVWHAAQKLLATHDVCDAHVAVVDDVSEVVRGVAIALDEDEIVYDLWAGRYIAHDCVVPGVGFGIAFEAEGGSAIPRWWVLGPVVSVEEWFFGGLSGFAELLDLLWCVGVSVCPALVYECLSGFAVPFEALALNIRCVGAADVGAFIVLDAYSPEACDKVFGAPGNLAFFVSVFKPEYKLAAGLPRDQVCK
jgi:hypothetical protein